MTMAERIRSLVKRHPKSRQQIANDLFITSECLGNYINGRRSPDVHMVRNMADYFQVSADYIICAAANAEKNAALPTIEQEKPAQPVSDNDAAAEGGFFAQWLWDYKL